MDTLHKILDLMWKKKISDAELCSKAHINKSAVTDWKKGKTKSYMRHLTDIAEADDITYRLNLNSVTRVYSVFLPAFILYATFVDMSMIFEKNFCQFMAIVHFDRIFHESSSSKSDSTLSNFFPVPVLIISSTSDIA